ncbi:MAG: hypothetical protein HC795_13400 [Coleofasciculaceae cyanobacterium RL_1_1]|nr:hypothetical protein [Coleofasciculaceae cyanobacterium RL_1_1]
MIVANGEDFVREGFTSKDGWAIAFDQVNVSLGEVVPLQGEVPGEAIAPQMVDLAAGDETAEPIALGTVTVPSGHYTGVNWSFAPSENQPSLTLVGTATKDDRTLNFNLAFSPDTAYTCGEYIGDVRKGFVEPTRRATWKSRSILTTSSAMRVFPPVRKLIPKGLGSIASLRSRRVTRSR